jgi:hypothetical protein
VYLDDIIIWGRTLDETIDNVELIFKCIREANLKLKPSKCKFFRQTIDVLGHVVSPAGISTDPAKTSLIMKWPRPQKLSDIRTFIGMTSYYRRFIKGYSEIVRPLTRLTTKDVQFRWTTDEQTAFDTLKSCLTTSPVLDFPTTDGIFILDTDASKYAIGAVLSQYKPGETVTDAKVIAYGSKTLTEAEINYDTRRKELLAVVHFLEHFRYYLEAKPFHLRTDHQPLKSLLSRKAPLSSQEARWAQVLWSFPIVDITYREGQKHGNADGMSRHPTYARPENEISDDEEAGIDSGRSYADAVDFCISSITTHLGSLPWNLEDLPRLQCNDPLLGYVFLAKNGDSTAIEKTGPYRKHLDSIIIDGDVLFMKSGEHPRRVLITKTMSEKLLPKIHDDCLSGHLGYKRTLKRARDRVFWPGMSRNIDDYVKNCAACQRNIKLHRKRRYSKPTLLVDRSSESHSMFLDRFPKPVPVTDSY